MTDRTFTDEELDAMAKRLGRALLFEAGEESSLPKDARDAIAFLRSRVGELEMVLGWYMNTLCELSDAHVECGKLTDDDCAGCRARTALLRKG